METLYEKEILDLFDKVKNQINEPSLLDRATNSITVMAEIDSTFQRLERAIKHLDAEARTKPNAESRRALEDRVKGFKTDAKALRMQFNQIEEAASRNALLNSNGQETGEQQQSNSQNSRLLSVSDRMDQSNSRLQDSRKNLSEIEDVALSISENLGRQRAQIASAHQKVRDTMGISDQANRILGLMERNEKTKKAVMYGVVGLLALLLLFAFYSIVLN